MVEVDVAADANGLVAGVTAAVVVFLAFTVVAFGDDYTVVCVAVDVVVVAGLVVVLSLLLLMMLAFLLLFMLMCNIQVILCELMMW